MQETNPLPWGALDRFDVHFIVKVDIDSGDIDYFAKAILTTDGHFGGRTVVSARWEGGGQLADILNDDHTLNEMIARQPVNQASIAVEPTRGAVRIHSRWQNRYDLGISKDLFEIYDRIAGHVRSLGSPPV